MHLQRSHNKAYTDRFLRHLERFIRQYHLFDKKEPLYITCSGGIDSMVLTHAIHQLNSYGYSNPIHLIHINHGTREGQDAEQALVEEFARFIGAKVSSHLLQGLMESSNFEEVARKERYQVFRDVAKGHKLLLAHHIDDSFEWAFLQNLRSSQVNSSLGIPLVNGNIIRPFMCVTKKHIEHYARFFDVPFLDDPTNESVKHERNFLRKRIISAFAPRHPQFLKHYVYRQNELARRLGLHVLKASSTFRLKMNKNCAELISLKIPSQTNGLRDQLRYAIHQLSSVKRGQLQGQLDKAMQALENNQQGPLTFSGGLQLVTIFNHLLLYSKGYHNNEAYHIEGHDQNAVHLYKQFSFKEFQSMVSRLLMADRESRDYPLWILLDGKTDWVSGQKRVHPLWPDLTQQLLDDEVKFISALNLMRQWRKGKNQKKSLRLRFLVRV
jgi:tRNA(Ile)-lysidine synthetase-like protein